MSFLDDFYKQLDKDKKKALQNRGTTLGAGEKASALSWRNDEIAPTKEYIEKTEKPQEERTWFKDAEGGFWQKVGGSIADFGEELSKGIAEIPEKLLDAMATHGTQLNQDAMMEAASGEIFRNRITGNNKESAEEVIERHQKLQEESEKETAKFVAKDILKTDKIDFVDDKYSVLGDKSESLIQSGGQLGAQIGANLLLPGSGMFLMGATAYGGEAENAFRNGATFDEGAWSATISAGAEILTEKLGGISFGGKTVTDAIFGQMSSKMTSKLANVLISTGKITADALAEGGEELLSGYMGALGQQMTYMEDKEIEELFSNEDKLESFIGGVVLGGISGSAEAVTQGKGYVTGLNKSEQKVFDKVYDDAMAKKEKDGKKLTSKEKSEIYNNILENMEKGNIEIDTIEEVLGGDDYKAYKEIADLTDGMTKEFDEIGNKTNPTLADQYKYSSLMEKIKANNAKKDSARAKLDKTMAPFLENSRLAESYNERARKGEAFKVDLNQYEGAKRTAYERAVKSGVLNNTNKSHALVDTLATIEADKGIIFDYADNKKLKELGFAVEGKTVNGFEKNGTVTLNVQSAKAWQSTVGHEIAHVLEGTDSYSTLQESLFKVAESKGELETRRAALTELYKGLDADIDKELTADLVGDYLFSDKNFINELTGNISTFKKIYNEIKYLCKVATGKQLTEIEKVRQEFDKVWKEFNANTNKKTDEKVNLSVSEESNFNLDNYTLDDLLKFTDEDFEKAYEALGLKDYFENESLDEVDSVFGGEDISIDEISEKINVEPEKIEILVRREGLGKSHIEENKTAVMTQERINRNVKDSGARFTPDYARRYITKISPKDFIDLTVTQKNIDRTRFDNNVEGDSGNTMQTYNYENALRESEQTPYLVIDRTTGQIIGHNGRHRMRALEIAGIESVEIEVELHDEDGAIIRYNSETIPDMAISSQFDTAIETHLTNIIPLNEAHRSEIESNYGEKAHAKAGVKYSLAANAKTELHKALYDKNYSSEVRLRDESPSIMVSQKGVKNLPMAMNASHIRENVFTEAEARKLGLRVNKHTHYHGLGEDFFLQVIDGLDNVKEAYRGTKYATDPSRRENYFLLISEFKDKDGNAINVPVYINEHAQYNRVFVDVNKISTVFGRESFRDYINRQIQNKNLVKIKNKSTQTSEPNALIARGYGKDASNGILTENGNGVKTNFSLSAETDAEYMLAVENGDMETAQRLVNEAAEKSGYTNNDDYKISHSAPYSRIEKEHFIDLDKLQELYEESADLNLFAIANGISLQPDDYFSPNGARWYMYDDADGMESYRAIKSAMNSIQQQMEQYGEVREMPTVKVYRAVPKSLKESKLQSGGQWVTPSYRYAVKHGNNALNGKYKIIEEIVSAENLWWDGNDIREWGFDDGTNYAYRDTKNNRKLLDAVAYDDEGNVIPLSKRFNFRNADERYSLSKQGEEFAPIGNYSTPLNETALAPMQEYNVTPTETVATNTTVDATDDIAPMPTDADAPPVMETEYYNTPNTTALDDATLNSIGKSLRETLSLTAEETNAIQDIVQEYSTSEMPNSEDLFNIIKEKFGEKYFREKDTDLAEIKRLLKTSPLFISDDVKGDITDWKAFVKGIRGKIRLSKDGLSVDKYYDQLVTEFPNRFNYGMDEVYGDLTNPLNQIRKIEAVANERVFKEDSLPLDDSIIREAVNIISNEVVNYKNNLNRTAAEDTAREALDSIAPSKAEQLTDGSRGEALLNQSLDNHPIKTVEDRLAEKIRAVEGEIADNKQLRREVERNYNDQIAELTEEYLSLKNRNTKKADDIIRRISRLENLKASHDADYAKRISDLEARAEKMKTEQYNRAMHKQDKMQGYAKWAEDLIGDTTTWKDKKIGLQYATNTEHRNLRDIVYDENGNKDIAKADAIYDATMGEYNRNQAARNRRDAEINKKYEALKVNRVESVYANMLGELRHNPETTLTEKDVNEYYEKHKKKIDTEKVDKFINYVRSDLDTFFEELNAKLREQGMKEIPYRKGYFPHKVEPKQNFIQKLLNWKTQDNEIPTSIAGLTEDFKPVKSWQSFDKQRHSDETDYDLLRLFQNYKQGALDWIYHIEDIQKRRAIENHIRFTHSDEGIQKRIKEVYANEEFDADEAQAQIEHILAEAKNPLNNFVQDFMTHTNILAGKKNSLDRTVEQATNRKIYTVMSNVQNRLSANMVLANVRSALTNFIPITQSWAQVSPLRSLQATKDTIANAIKDDGMIEKSTFLTNRLREAESLYKTNWDKILDKAGIMFEIVDNFSSQVIWRSKYNDNLAKGMSESEAIANADQFAENVMAGRSKGNEPTLFNAKNPLVKAFTMFQLEVNNQYGYLFKDAPNDLKAETNHWKLNLAKGYTTAFIGAYVYNTLLEQVAGSGAALDPIGIIEDLLKDLGLFDDDEEKEPAEVITNFTKNVVEELPFVGGLFGGGRIPISSALPYEDDGLTGFVEDISEGNWGNIGKEMMNPLLNVGLPVGGGQIKKTYQGLSMFNTDEDHPVAGSYTDSGALRFPVEDTVGNRIQAGIFGQYASKNAREYFDGGYAPLKEKQIQEYMDVDLPIADYWKYREGLSGLKKNAEKADYINSLDITNRQKNVLMNNILDRKEDVDMSNYDNYGSFEEFDYAQKNPEKYAFFNENGISYDYYSSLDEDGKAACTWAYNNPEKYKASKVITDDVVEYRSYTSDLYDIKADKDAYGETITGSGKAKKVEYINNLDLEYGQKIILFKMQYKSDDTYNADIINYLNNLDNLTYEDRMTIFTELGFTVKDGYVYWD